jgi:uncharacterized YccA/Bax inhibitor family protein
MIQNQSSNIAMGGFKHVNHSASSHDKMTLSGTLNKTLILTLLVFVGGFFSWSGRIGAELFMPVFIITLIVSLGIVFTLMFKPLLANILAPIYAVVEGVFLGMVSLKFNGIYDGIVTQAILLTLVIALVMNFLYRNEIIKVTEKFKAVIFGATLGIFGVYMLSMILSFFGTGIPLIHESGLVGIGFSLFVVTIASLNLLMDFHFIDKQVEQNMPKKMEWYGGFMLIVTLIWIYIEILRLLSKIRNRN